MASRLNQQLREKRGLAYSIYSFSDFLLGTGALGVSLGTEPAQATIAVELVAKEIRRLREKGLSRKDLRFAKDYAAGSAVLALESPSARMQHLGKCQLLYGRPLGLGELLETVEKVTVDEIAQAIETEFPELETRHGWSVSAVVPEGFDQPLLA
jgi:predicted Zn-dependent peptidase